MHTIRQANEIIFSNIEGWVGDRIWLITEFIQQDHRQHCVSGAIAEIGVHHGKLFYLLSHIASTDDDLVAIDVFGDQTKNVDSSGAGSLDIFIGHAEHYFPYLTDRIQINQCDSLSLTVPTLPSVFKSPVRVFSIDGGHTVQHVISDMTIAQEVLASRGVVMLDDFFGPVWPSVTEGFFKYMNTHNRRLAPFLVFQNKLFLTTFSEHDSILTSLRSFLDRSIGDEIHSERWRYSALCGLKVLCFG
jgi:Methyltransferase domain